MGNGCETKHNTIPCTSMMQSRKNNNVAIITNHSFLLSQNGGDDNYMRGEREREGEKEEGKERYM